MNVSDTLLPMPGSMMVDSEGRDVMLARPGWRVEHVELVSSLLLVHRPVDEVKAATARVLAEWAGERGIVVDPDVVDVEVRGPRHPLPADVVARERLAGGRPAPGTVIVYAHVVVPATEEVGSDGRADRGCAARLPGR